MNANVQSIIESRMKTQLNSKGEFDISSLLCQTCGSSLVLNYINETKQMLTCSNSSCIFPFDSEDMKKYICQSNDIKSFLRSVYKMLSRPSTQVESESDNDILSQDEQEEERVFPDDFY